MLVAMTEACGGPLITTSATRDQDDNRCNSHAEEDTSHRKYPERIPAPALIRGTVSAQR